MSLTEVIVLCCVVLCCVVLCCCASPKTQQAMGRARLEEGSGEAESSGRESRRKKGNAPTRPVSMYARDFCLLQSRFLEVTKLRCGPKICRGQSTG
jgi:hypothetical protein